MLRVKNLHKAIGKNEILHDVSFTIPEVGVTGLLGPNGAGKSTLMKILVGLWDFQSGEVQIDGIMSQQQLPHSVTQKIGYLPENNPLYEEMYVVEYLTNMLAFKTTASRSDKTEIARVIEAVHLTGMANKKIRELSKGYRQRVGLACALLNDPHILILDEPTTGLDPNQLDEMRSLIRSLGQTHIVLLSTHILQEVKAVCSRVLILSHGKLVEDTTDLTDLENLFRNRTND